MKIAKLDKVDLRQVWPHEAHDFTKWLAERENLELLSDEIGIGIELVQVVANVGRYNVDILAQEENTSKKIIIENQLETTNHSQPTFVTPLPKELVLLVKLCRYGTQRKKH